MSKQAPVDSNNELNEEESNPSILRILILGVVLCLLGAASIWSVWTSTNRPLSMIFGLGGILLILAGLWVIQFYANVKLHDELEAEFDPELIYSEKRLKWLLRFSAVAALFLFMILRFSTLWFDSLLLKWYFALAFGSLAGLLSAFITKKLKDRIPELQAAVQEAISCNAAIWISISLIFYFVFLGVNYISARQATFSLEQAVVLEKNENYDKDSAVNLFVRNKEWSFHPHKSTFDSMNKGDSLQVHIHSGKLGFDHLFNFQQIVEIKKN